MAKISIIGAGAFGTALSLGFEKSNEVILYAHGKENFDSIIKNSENITFFKGFKIPNSIKVTNNLEDCFDSDYMLLVTPSQYVRSTVLDLKEIYNKRKHIPTLLLCSKGLEQTTGKLLTEIIDEEIPNVNYGVLTGPAFAVEIGQGLPTALTLSMKDINIATKLIEDIKSPSIRLYANDDIIGTQIGGAVKNVLAIATGVATGLGLGNNAVAVLISRGLVEMQKFAITLGGKNNTIMGLSGLGDLVLTATSEKSRNFRYGVEVAKGNFNIDESKGVVEGKWTAKAVLKRATELNVDMPICFMVYEVLYNNLSIEMAISKLMNRPLKQE